MKKLTATLALSVLVTACATPREFNRVDPGARAHLQDMETVLFVTQEEIGTEINVSNMATATGGGLIPALIDASVNADRTKKAEELVGPLRDKLIDYDFGAQLESAIEAELAETGVEGAGSVDLQRAIDKNTMADRVGASVADAVMFINSTYKLTPDFDAVVATADVKVYPVNPALNAYKEKPDEDEKMTEHTDNIYRNNFRAVVPLEVAGSRDLNAEEVAKMPTEEWVSLLDQSAARLAAQIAGDFMKDDVVEEK